MPQDSAFKQLFSEMFKAEGDFSKLASTQKNQIKCYVKESFPYFLVTDNYFYVACYFTKKAVDDFRNKYSSANITDLKSRVIIITDWTLEMNKVDSANIFTSYGGLEVRLVARAFKLAPGSDKVVLSRHPLNLFRDDEMKTLIQGYTHKQIGAAVGAAKAVVPEISTFASRADVKQGVLGFAPGASFTAYNFKEGKTQTVDMQSVFKQEKGADALKRLLAGSGSSGKAKVTGGATSKKSGSRSAKKSGLGTRSLVNKIMKQTPGGKGTGSNTAQKRSTLRLGAHPNIQSPGNEGGPGTAQVDTMQEFRKMVRYLNQNKQKASGRAKGKSSTGKKSAKK
jgi:hypothetical protein